MENIIEFIFGDMLWMFLILPIFSLIFSLMLLKNSKLALLTTSPNLILIAFATVLNIYGVHSNYARALIKITPNLFNISVWTVGIIWSIMIHVIAKNKIESKRKRVINSILFFVMYIINFILIEFIYGSCM